MKKIIKPNLEQSDHMITPILIKTKLQYQQLPKCREKWKTHTKQLYAKVTRNTLFYCIGNCLPSFHQLHNWYRKMIDCQ